MLLAHLRYGCYQYVREYVLLSLLVKVFYLLLLCVGFSIERMASLIK